jgi:uncharacterized membrane protein
LREVVALQETVRGSARPFVGAVRGVSAGAVVWAATAVSAGGWATVAAVRELLYNDKRQDLGNFTQAVWATAHGHFFQVTEAGGAEISRLGIHVDPIIAVFAPLWWLWPSPLLLVTTQAILLALGAVPLFWLGRKHLPHDRDAALVAGAYLLCPTVAWNAVIDFHAVALAVPLLLFAIWYLDEDRLLAFGVASGAAVLCQEQIGLLVCCLGLWYAWRRGHIRPGIAIAAAGFAVSATDFLLVLRHFSGGTPFASRFGGSPTTILRELFTHPLRVAGQVNGHDLLGFLPAVPVLGFCFGSTILLAASPQIAILLLSRRAGDWGWFGINVLILIPFIYTATLFTLARSTRRTTRKSPPLVGGQVFTASLAVAFTIGPFGIFGVGELFQSHAVTAQQHAVSLVPPNARVSATNHLSLPLAARRYLYVFPVLKDADWVLVDARDASLPNVGYIHHRAGINVGVDDLTWQPRLMRRELGDLRRSPAWRLVYRRNRIYVFRRR